MQIDCSLLIIVLIDINCLDEFFFSQIILKLIQLDYNESQWTNICLFFTCDRLLKGNGQLTKLLRKS
jgi:hypothetical protein